MILKQLRLELRDYGSDKGNYVGSASFVSDSGTVEVRLSAEQAREILMLCADGIITEAKKVADAMISQVIEHDKKDLA